MTEITRYTPPQLHPAELRMFNEYDVIPAATSSVERLSQAELTTVCNEHYLLPDSALKNIIYRIKKYSTY